MEKTKTGLDENIAASVAYSVPPLAIISGFIMLVLEPENKFVRFHAMQSFIVFMLLSALTAIAGLLPFIGRPISTIMGIITLVSWLTLIISAFMGKYVKFPLVGNVVYNKIIR